MLRVISREKGLYRLSNGEEERLAEVSGRFLYSAENMSDYPAVGDYVTAGRPEDGSNAIIESILPRRSVFMRRAGCGRTGCVLSPDGDLIEVGSPM